MKKPKLSSISKGIRGAITKHSPEILTGIGIAGMITTTIMAVRATPKALILIEERKEEIDADKLTPIELIKTTNKEKYETSQEVRKILVEFADDLLAELKERVEVVRCKDCIYGKIDDEDLPWQYYCQYNGNDWNNENHYCSYGERKDED